MAERLTRSKASSHQHALDNNANAGPSTTSHGSSQPSQEDPSLSSEATPERDSPTQALLAARAQKAVTPLSSTDTSPGHGDSAGDLSQKESFPSLAELMGNDMEVCPDVLSDPLKQFQELLDAKELQIKKVSIVLAARLHQVQKILDTQPLDAHASLLSQRNSITVPLQSQLDLLDSEVALLKESIARLAPPSIPNSVLPSRGGVVSAPHAPVAALDASN
ncbi:hypothetical protein BG000_001796, partial [Podila horticola]